MSEVITGMDEILRKLDKLPQKIKKSVLSGAVRAAAKPIIKEARALAPENLGILKMSIDVVKRKSENPNIIHYSIAPLNKKGGFYGGFIEFGTYAKLDHSLVRKSKGKRGKRREEIVAKGFGITHHPFMRPAFEKKAHETIDYAREYMRKRIDRELAKL
ncbi:MAG: hypothetical protein GXP61_08065 [Epsilonproteobacteria bacterium]|nr:hypothetical protein [Campylobacterota bacterium]